MSPKKLTDTQLVLLSAASQRKDGSLELTGNPKGSVARKTITKLLNVGLVEGVAAGGTLPVWRREFGRLWVIPGDEDNAAATILCGPFIEARGNDRIERLHHPGARRQAGYHFARPFAA
jgi:hypothetical protein